MKILFVGNSYTFFNHLPDMLYALMQENCVEGTVESVTKGGRRLYENLNPDDPLFARLMQAREGGVDLLILQEQSFFPLVDANGFLRGVRGLIELLSPARTVLYSTWGRKEGAPLLAERGWTAEGMGKDLHEAYGRVAAEVDALVSPVGKCFAAFIHTHPEWELYNEDGSHPSYLGSALAVLSHYRTCFGELPTKTSSLNLKKEEQDACSVLFF